MSDREAFVQAIAANPTDDLPRLVFADWLEEHGDPERAEFIRTQIRWHHAADEERKQLDLRAGELFREYWQRWFGPLILALDPVADLTRDYRYRGDPHPARLADIHPSFPLRDDLPLTPVLVSRGFVSNVRVHLRRWAGGASVAQAFRYEPVTALECHDGLHSPRWAGFTDPVLRQVEQLSVRQQWAWAVSAPESTALLEDPHLAGVREFTLDPLASDVTDRHPLPSPWVTRFVRSPLAYRLSGLNLLHIGDDAVPALCKPGRLHLERLSLGGPLAIESVRRLGDSDLGETVRVLRLNGCDLGSGGIAALARGDWRRLTHLELRGNQLTLGGLRSFTTAGFLGQLVSLDLSDNVLFETTQDKVEHGLRMLSDALDPERLEHLNLTDTGVSHVPDFLAERFGDRMTV